MVMEIMEQIIELEDRQSAEVTAAKALIEESRNLLCGRSVKSGRPCKNRRKASQPACTRHCSGDELRRYGLAFGAAQKLFQEYWWQLEPCCWRWPITDADRARVAAAKHPMRAIHEWQRARCAVCGAGERRRQLVLDHDHFTGLSRGWLCDMCNQAEGHPSGNDEYEKYRQRNPASMFGVRDVYEGPWWNPNDFLRNEFLGDRDPAYRLAMYLAEGSEDEAP